jgi:aryl-alcohol dehydrogenase-like predicted oxidoreductase
MPVLSRFALGTVQFGLPYGVANMEGQVSPSAVSSILKDAQSYGINLLDTATAYGESESILGKSGVRDWRIVTKLPAVPDHCTNIRAWVDEQISASLTRLGVESLYGVLLHRPDQLFLSYGPELMASMQSIKVKGWAKKTGVSIYASEEIAPLFELGDFDLLQAPLNILDRCLVSGGHAARLKQRGVELHVRSAFLQGLLLIPSEHRPAKFSRWKRFWIEWDRWLVEHGLTPLEACLRYVSSIAEIDKIVVGVNSRAQLREIAEITTGELPSLPVWPDIPDPELINPSFWKML